VPSAHALDQFLEGILSFYTGDVLRLGSRSSSEIMKQHNINSKRTALRRDRKAPVALHRERVKARVHMNKLKEVINKISRLLSTRKISISQPFQQGAFFFTLRCLKSVNSHFLNKKLVSLHHLKPKLLVYNCLKRFDWQINAKQRKQIKRTIRRELASNDNMTGRDVTRISNVWKLEQKATTIIFGPISLRTDWYRAAHVVVRPITVE
jgi:hypothetical protein